MATYSDWVVRSPAAVGRAVKNRRESLTLTQQQVAERAVTNRYAVMKIEDGAATRQLTALFDVLYALDLEFVIRPRSGGLL